MKSIKSQTYFFTATLFLILAVLVGFAVNSALMERRFVERNKVRDELAFHLNLAAQSQAVERGLGATIIGSGESGTTSLRSAFRKAAGEGDEHVRKFIGIVEKYKALESDRKLEKYLDRWRAGYEGLKQLRNEVVKNNITREEWIAAATDNINNEFDLRNYTFVPGSSEESKETEIIYLRTILRTNIATLAEYAGLERALVANTIAEGAHFSPDTLSKLESYRSIVDHAVKEIMFFKKHEFVTDEMKKAINRFEKEFLERYQKLRENIYAESERQRESIKKASLRIRDIKIIFRDYLATIRADFVSVARLESVAELTGAMIGGKQNIIDEYTRKVADEFSALARIRKSFDRIRILDISGRERVRVNFKNNNAEIVGENHLQDKSDRYYFKRAMSLKNGEIYVSPIDLNKENGKIEIPYKAVMRYATPIYVDGAIGSIVVVNLLIHNEPFIHFDSHENGGKEDDYMLIDQDGFYIHHPKNRKEWGMMAELKVSGGNIENDYPYDMAGILSGSNENIRFSYKNSIVYSPFFFNPRDRSRFWVLIRPVKSLDYPLSAEAWFEKSTNAINSAIAISIAAYKKGRYEMEKISASSGVKLVIGAVLILFAIIIFSLFLIFSKKYLLQPVEKLIDFTKRVGGGDFSHTVEIHTGNEIEDLGRSFNAMTMELKESRKSLIEKEVLQESEERFRTIIESSSDALITIGRNGLISMFNSAAEKMFGQKSREMIGKTLNPIIPEEFRERHIRAMENFLSTGRLGNVIGRSVEMRGLRSDGTAFPIALTLTYGGHGGKMFVLGNIRDITEQKKVENEILQHRNNLQQLVEQQTVTLVDAVKEAREANRAKSEFLANMSHELRTPMNVVLGFSDIGQNKSDGISVAKLKEYFDIFPSHKEGLESVLLDMARSAGVNENGLAKEAARELETIIEKRKFFSGQAHQFFSMIQTSGKELMHLLNDLLDLSKLEADKMEYDMREHDLAEVAQTVADEFELLAKERLTGIRIEKTGVGTTAWFDRNKIKQVIRNLYSNAIKFTGRSTLIETSFTDAKLSTGHWKNGDDCDIVPALAIIVRDHGIGIPEEELEVIFDTFIQSSKTKTKAGGTGLGLSISRRIVYDHHGEIWAENHPYGGAVFKVVLPRQNMAKYGK